MRKFCWLIFLTSTVLFRGAVVSTFPQTQKLLLPGPSPVAQGEGACNELIVGIASPNWRVRKGRVFGLSAIHPFSSTEGVSYKWTVSNGTIVSGQGTPRIEVKASNRGTPGFLNASGFVSVSLRAERTIDGMTCALEVDSQVMIGKFGEYNGFAEVRDVSLDEYTLMHKCAPGQTPAYGAQVSEDMIVGVSTKADDPENDVLSYRYIVSGGKILGHGAKVSWDVSDLSPGTYSISVGADDGFGIRGQTVTKTITVLDCPIMCGLVPCPEIEVTGPDDVKAGEIEIFEARVRGGVVDSVNYNWTVINGEIVDGQGSPSIKVRIPAGKIDTTITLSVTLHGLSGAAGCSTEASKVYKHGPF